MRFIVTRHQPEQPIAPKHFAEYLYNTALATVNKNLQDRLGMFSPLNDPSIQHARQVQDELLRLLLNYPQHRKLYDSLMALDDYTDNRFIHRIELEHPVTS